MTTVSERARARATQSRLRAYIHFPKAGRDSLHWYTVKNLTNGNIYTVYRASLDPGSAWRCTCPTRDQRCKHIQRVMDREEVRTKTEALQTAREYEATTRHAEAYDYDV